MATPILLSNEAEAVEFLRARVSGKIKIATALGLGKPIFFFNTLYDTAIAQNLDLEIYTALSLQPPSAKKNSLEERFLTPFLNRHFGENYPELKFAKALKSSNLPPNIRVHEFYFQAGQLLHSEQAQRSYQSVNYTYVARSLYRRGINAVAQLVAKKIDANGKTRYSFGSNPDVTLDLLDLYRESEHPLVMIAVVHPDLPFSGGDAEVDASQFTAILENPGKTHKLFALPRPEVEPADHMIGFHASQLVEDGGTLQIGIGALSDSLVNAMLLRHQKNPVYQKLQHEFGAPTPPEIEIHHEVFHKGLYGTSEMVMDGFMHLRKAGILKRMIYDVDEHKRRYLHGAFFLGSNPFYDWLRNLNEEDFSGFGMTRVSKVNDLYDEHEYALRRQRQKARFFNTAFKVTMLGAAASDTLDDGRVISGVGGQYNFVSMAHELHDARSVILLRSTRDEGKNRTSSVVSHYPNETIPRHLRDIVITEYGIADLRGKTEEETIKAMVEVTDFEFQEDLIVNAQKSKKLAQSYRPPDSAQRNTFEHVQSFVEKNREHFLMYPFGSDFTDLEIKILSALKTLKYASTGKKLSTLLRGLFLSKGGLQSELERLRLSKPKGFVEHIYASIVAQAIEDLNRRSS